MFAQSVGCVGGGARASGWVYSETCNLHIHQFPRKEKVLARRVIKELQLAHEVGDVFWMTCT